MSNKMAALAALLSFITLCVVPAPASAQLGFGWLQDIWEWFDKVVNKYDVEVIANLAAETGEWATVVSQTATMVTIFTGQLDTLKTIYGTIDNLSLKDVARVKVSVLAQLKFNDPTLQQFFFLMEGATRLSDVKDPMSVLRGVDGLFTRFEKAFPDSFNPGDAETPPLVPLGPPEPGGPWDFRFEWGDLLLKKREAEVMREAERQLAWRKALILKNQANLASLRGLNEENGSVWKELTDRIAEADKSGKTYDVTLAQLEGLNQVLHLQTEVMRGNAELDAHDLARTLEWVGERYNIAPAAIESICQSALEEGKEETALYMELGE